MPLRIGVFGGTFDPPHIGHLVTAVNVRAALSLDQVLFVVANIPWQKAGRRPISPAADRLALVTEAVRGLDGLEPSAIEIRLFDQAEFQDLGQSAGPTTTGDDPPKRIDYVWGLGVVGAQAHTTADTNLSSDHRALIVNITRTAP